MGLLPTDSIFWDRVWNGLNRFAQGVDDCERSLLSKQVVTDPAPERGGSSGGATPHDGARAAAAGRREIRRTCSDTELLAVARDRLQAHSAATPTPPAPAGGRGEAAASRGVPISNVISCTHLIRPDRAGTVIAEVQMEQGTLTGQIVRGTLYPLRQGQLNSDLYHLAVAAGTTPADDELLETALPSCMLGLGALQI